MSHFSKNQTKPLRIRSTETITILLPLYYLHQKEVLYSLVLFNLKTTLNFLQSISNDKKGQPFLKFHFILKVLQCSFVSLKVRIDFIKSQRSISTKDYDFLQMSGFSVRNYLQMYSKAIDNKNIVKKQNPVCLILMLCSRNLVNRISRI